MKLIYSLSLFINESRHILSSNYLKFNNHILLSFILITFSSNSYGQDFHSALQARNSHLWRGIEVASGLVFTGDLHLDGEHFYGGFWSGGSSDGSYKEFDNYAGFKKGNSTQSYGIFIISHLMPHITTQNFLIIMQANRDGS